MRIGDRIKSFESSAGTVLLFNMIFSECPLTGHHDTDIVEIGEITKATTTRLITINNKSFEHKFERRLESEDIILSDGTNITDDDYFWLCNFV